MQYSDYDMIICSNQIKKELLRNYSFSNIKYMTIDEFKNKYLYQYKSDTLYYLVNKYKLLPENAKIILNNLYYVKKGTEKMNDLLKIKEDLIENNYIIFNNDFKVFIKNKKILIIGYDKNLENQLLFEGLNVNYMASYNEKRKIVINEFADIDEEVVFVANKITDLILNDVDINSIKLVLPEEVYDSVINKIFKLFNIPFYKEKISMYDLTSVKKMLKTIDLNDDINIFKQKLDIKNEEIKQKILDILNKYPNIKLFDFYDVFIYELKNNYLTRKYNNVVKQISLDEVKNNEFTFILGFNQDVIYKPFKDDDYLSDEELSILKLDTSKEKNEFLKAKVLNILNGKNIFVSYKLKTPFDNYTIANLCEELDCIIEKPIYDFSNERINKILLSYKIDDLIKYNIKSENINELYTNTEINYNTYDNKYKKIDYEILENKIKDLNLSFSNIDVFYKCKFRFFIENILKIKKSKETISLEIGNLFHKVLEIYYKTQNDINLVIDEVLKKENQNKKEAFFYHKYRKLLLELVNIIDEQLKNTNYKNTYFEKWFSIIKDKDLNIKVVGKIDKIMTFSDKENNYVIVVDYKTGSLHADFNKVIYGMDMQLLVYLYLIKNTGLIKEPNFTGMYLEPILTEVLKNEKNKTYLDLLKKEYKWVGYTLDNSKRVEEIDNNYLVDSFINGLKSKNDGTFYSYSKVLSVDAIDKLLDIVSFNIENVIKNIKISNFEIDPKRIENENVSCKFCPYQDICFMTNNDIKNLKKYKNLEFLEVDDETSRLNLD